MLIEPHRLGSRDHLKYTPIDENLRNEYEQILANLSGVAFNKNNDPINLEISAAAWGDIGEYRNKIEPKLADGKKYSNVVMREVAGKIEQQIMKISACLHVYENKSKSNLIESRHVQTAINIVDEILMGIVSILEEQGQIGKSAEEEAVMAGFSTYTVRTTRQIIQSRKKVMPFKGMKNRNEIIRATLEELRKRGLLTYNEPTKEYCLND